MKLYDMNDEDYKEYVKGLCLAGLPIPFYNKEINYLTVKEVLRMGNDNYYKMISIFAFNKEYYLKDSKIDIPILDILDKQQNSYEIFDLIIDFLVITLNLETKPVPSRIANHLEINVGNGELYIDSDKFEEFRKIILYMYHLKEVQLSEEIKENIASEGDKKRFEKLFKGRKKKAEAKKKMDTISNVYNYVVHKQQKIDYESVLNWSIFRLYNTFDSFQVEESCKFNRDLYSSGMTDLKKVEIPSFYIELTKIK